MFLRLFCALLASTAGLAAGSSVWKVSRGGQTFYLGGTIHMLRPGDFPLPPEFDRAFAASRRIIFETDVARVQSTEMQAIVVSRGMFTDGTTLDQMLTPAAWRAARDYCAKAGLPVEQMRRMKPWLFTLMMAAVELQKLGVSSEGVDLTYFKQAGAAGKSTGELESFERHVEHIVNLGAGQESAMIAKSLEDLNELPVILNDLIAAWRAGDLARIDRLMLRDIRRKYPAVFKRLLTDRNAAWQPKLEALLRTPEVEFVLVGAAHLAGPEGLLTLLRARGCTIERLELSPRPSP